MRPKATMASCQLDGQKSVQELYFESVELRCIVHEDLQFVRLSTVMAAKYPVGNRSLAVDAAVHE